MTDAIPVATSGSAPIRRIDVVGLGPAGPELITAETRKLINEAGTVYLRTTRHPAAAAFPDATSFDDRYESEFTFDDVYRAIVADLVAAAHRSETVVYAVPGSPVVAERTVGLLREDAGGLGRGDGGGTPGPLVPRCGVHPARGRSRDHRSPVVDAESFASSAAGERGPLLVAQCWSRAILSEIKLSAELPSGALVTVLSHLGLDDEQVIEVAWDELDRTFDPDHLTSLWIPTLAAPVASELVRLDELAHTLRERCPWDREQTHGSLARHLLEESYEVLEAIDDLATVDRMLNPDDGGGGAGVGAGVVSAETEERAVAHLEEELGDLLFQVYFHSTLAAESGRFTLADVARGVHDKLVARHPHVFGDVNAATADQVAANWETSKKAEKNRKSVTDGIPAALPALALATKLQRKGVAVGMKLPGLDDEASHLAIGMTVVAGGAAGMAGTAGRTGLSGPVPPSGTTDDDKIGDLLFSLVNVARTLGVDPESALRAKAAAFRASVEALG